MFHFLVSLSPRRSEEQRELLAEVEAIRPVATEKNLAVPEPLPLPNRSTNDVSLRLPVEPRDTLDVQGQGSNVAVSSSLTLEALQQKTQQPVSMQQSAPLKSASFPLQSKTQTPEAVQNVPTPKCFTPLIDDRVQLSSPGPLESTAIFAKPDALSRRPSVDDDDGRSPNPLESTAIPGKTDLTLSGKR